MNKMLSQTVSEPDVLVGMGINWDKYTPPGGYGWQDQFRTDGKRGLDVARREIIKRRDDIASFEIQRAELKKGIAGLETFLASLESSVGKRFINAVNEAVSVEAFKNAALTMCSLFKDSSKFKETDFQNQADEGEKLAIEQDLAFVNALERFFDYDLETDMLLFALGKADVKYRTKILRSAIKTLKEVEECMNVIDNTKSFLKKPFFDALYEQPYTTLRRCYSRTLISVRALKKKMDSMGNRLWELGTLDDYLGCDTQDYSKMTTEWSYGKPA